jgi:hypothetical protein
MATRSENLQTTPVVGRQRLRTLAIVPAYNEEGSLGQVLEEIHAADPDIEVIVVDDGSTDRTSAVASAAGARVATLPYNIGIGGAVQTGYQYALEHGFEVAIQVDGDGQHDPSEMERVLEPILEGRADLVVGTRFVAGGGYRGTRVRRVGIRIFAAVVSLMVGQRVSDTTSGFRAVNGRALRLFRPSTRTTTPRSSRSSSSRATACGCSRCRCRCASARAALRPSPRCARPTT